MLGRRLRVLVPAVALAAAAVAPPPPAAPRGAPAATGGSGGIQYSEYRISSSAMSQLRSHFVDQVLATHRTGTWAPMKMTLSDSDLRAMGLPSKKALLGHRFPQPTFVTPDGQMQPAAALPTVATFAGTGYFGIRPGAWLLTVTNNEIG